MSSIAENLATWAGKTAGVNIGFSDGALVLDLTPEQTARAQSFVRALLAPKKDAVSGKSKLNFQQTWEVVGLPVLETYGFYIAAGVGGLVAVGIVVGRLTQRRG